MAASGDARACVDAATTVRDPRVVQVRDPRVDNE